VRCTRGATPARRTGALAVVLGVWGLQLAGPPCRGMSQGPAAKSLLILNSYHPGYDWTDDVTRGVRSVLDREPYVMDYHVEYMDTKRYSGEAYFEQLRRFHADKYRNQKFDLVITTDDDALEFALQNRGELFRAAPVVFCGVNSEALAARAPRGSMTGVVELYDIAEILNMAVGLHGGTRRVYVVSDNSSTGAAVKAAFEDVARGRKDLTFQFLDGREMSLEALEQALAQAPEGSLVIATGFQRDGSGAYFRRGEAHRRLARATSRPVYTTGGNPGGDRPPDRPTVRLPGTPAEGHPAEPFARERRGCEPAHLLL